MRHKFIAGDLVELLHRGMPTGEIAVVREVREEAECLLVDLIGEEKDDLPVYDKQDQFTHARCEH